MGNLSRLSAKRPVLASPSQLFRVAPVQPRPPLNQVSSLLKPDQLQPLTMGSKAVLAPLFPLDFSPVEPASPLKLRAITGPALAPASPRWGALQKVIIDSGIKEWQKGVRESGQNRGTRIDQYARNAKFGPGYQWCGFFAAWNYTQGGFKTPESFASYQKSRDFFLYRSYTSRDPGLHRSLDQLRQQQLASGSSRQYFIMQGSPTYDYVRDNRKYYGHVNLEAMTRTWQTLPLQPGDIALFSKGHIGTVVSYDARSGILETVEGNASGKGPDGKNWDQAVVRNRYDLSKAQDRKEFDGFGRAALGDFA